MLYLGIDPGVGGGLGLIDDLGHCVASAKMPETPRDLCDLVTLWWRDADMRAAVEFVRATPQMGVTSAFTFGRGYGVICGVLAGVGLPHEEVRPQIWQRAIGCMTKGDKNVSKAKAQQIFPNVKVTHAIADSLLIAEWLRRREIGVAR